jgi:multidrug resistance efflux pump
LDLKTAEVRSAIEAESFKLAVEEARAQYEQIRAETKLLEESQRAQIRATEIDHNQAKLELQRAEANVEKMVVRAPMDGIVVMQTLIRNGESAQIKQGDQVAAGQTFMTIVDPTSMVINGTVNQVDSEKLRLGMKASARLDAYPDIQLPATVIGIGAMTKPGAWRMTYVGEIPVRLKLNQVEARVIPDLSASADVVLESEAEATVAPRAAVFEEEGGKPFVFVQTAAGWIRKEVELGVASHIAVAVRSGLKKGDVLALQRPT